MRQHLILAAVLLLVPLSGCGFLGSEDANAELRIHNGDDVEHTVTLTVTADGETVIDDEQNLAPDDVWTPQNLTEPTAHEITVETENESTTETIELPLEGNEYSLIGVEIRSDETITITTITV